MSKKKKEDTSKEEFENYLKDFCNSKMVDKQT